MCTHFRCEHKICIMSKIMGNMHNPMLKCMLCNTNVIYLEQMKGVFEGRLVCVLTRSLRDHERARKRSWYHVSTIWKISIRSVSVKYKIQLARVASRSETSDKPWAPWHKLVIGTGNFLRKKLKHKIVWICFWSLHSNSSHFCVIS